MKNYNKYIKSVFIGTLSLLTLASCSEDKMDEINKNKDNPLTAQARFVLTDLQTQTAFRVVGGDFSLYSSIYIEQEAGVHNQMYNAEKRVGEPTSTATYNNSWESVYSNIMMARVIIDKCTAESGADSANKLTLAMAKVLLAYNGAIATDLFGDTPYSQAGVLDQRGLVVYRQPVLDAQKSIYDDAIKQLDEAIELFKTGSDLTPAGSNDLIYKGNKESWLKAAYGLKARYTMRLLNKSADKNKSLQDVLTYINQSFKSSSEEFKFDIYDGAAQNNPLYSFSLTRQGLGVSQSLVDKLTERKDPRLTQWIMSAGKTKALISDPKDILAAPNGEPVQSQGKYSCLITDYSPTAPSILLSYHELLFLKAEAYARLGDKVNAETALKSAITAGFANLQKSLNSAVVNKILAEVTFDLSASVSDKYYTTSVKALFDASPLKEIMIQKYIALTGANGESVESYNDYRRMIAGGENFIKLNNAANPAKFPLRFTYGSSDATTNPNIGGIVSDGTYVYSESVWWAGGTR